MARKRKVQGSGAVTVEDGRHLTRATGATGGTLAELGTRLGDDTDLGHDGYSSNDAVADVGAGSP